MDGGTHNTPYETQEEYSDVPLAKDPNGSGFNFWDLLDFLDFSLPELPVLQTAPLFGLTAGGMVVLFVILLIMVILFGLSVFISSKFRTKSTEAITVEEESQIDVKELIKRRETLGNRINEIITFLETSITERSINEAITLGFEQLDLALKEFSKISRPRWLTPREYAEMRIPYFDHESLSLVVEIFYEITYGERTATMNMFNSFLSNIKLMITDQTILSWKSDQKSDMES